MLEPFAMPDRAAGHAEPVARPRRVRITTGSRLHFGMFSFGRTDVRQFGGLGVMVERPGVQLELSLHEAHAENEAVPLTQRARAFIRQLATPLGLADEIVEAIRVRVERAPAQHTGLGVGTQAALAVGRGVEALLGLTPLPVEQLARLLGRGRRSAVGIHGFALGGLIVEAGKRADDVISPLVARVALPEAWRFVLLTPAGQAGLSGEAEVAAFGRMPAVPRELTDKLCHEALLNVVPAAQEGDAAAFGAAIDRFGRLAGQCFAAQQGGVYASQRVEQLAEAARAAGALGVAQSSWGPTLAALTADEAAAQTLVATLRSQTPWQAITAVITAPRNRPATVTSS